MISIVDTIHETRKEIDSLIQNALKLKETYPSAESTLAHRNLQETKHSFGTVLKHQRLDTPYKEVDNEKDIPPTSDTAKSVMILEKTRLGAVNQMRKAIEEQVERIDALYANRLLDTKLAELFFTQAYVSLTKAGNWYGEELASMREVVQEKEEVDEEKVEDKKVATSKTKKEK